MLDETVDEVVDDPIDESVENWQPRDSAEGLPPYDVVLVPPFPSMRVISWLPKIRRPDGEAERDSYGDQILGKRAWFALDNRRLHVLQHAAASRWPRRCCVAVRCIEEVPGGSTMKEIRKFRTTTEGRSVEVGIRVGETETFTWPQAAPPDSLAREDAIETEGLYAEDLWDAVHWAPRAVAAGAKGEAADEGHPQQETRETRREARHAAVAAHQHKNKARGDDVHHGGRLGPCPEMGWTYIDPRGAHQGPFPLAKMRLWYQHGYFLPELPMRCDERDAFVPFLHMFPAPNEPFLGLVMRYPA